MKKINGIPSDTLGIIKHLDNLGRLVLPIDFRRSLGWEKETPLEVLSNGESIVIRKYVQGCTFCKKEENIVLFEQKPVCRDCLLKLTNKTTK